MYIYNKMKKYPLFVRIIALALTTVFVVFSFVGCKGEEPESTPEATPNDLPAGAEPKKRVALTFDDGPQHANGEETKKIVDELAKYGYTATFFVVGNRIAGGDALSYAASKGNEIGIHGYTHNNYYDTCNDSIYEQEISKTLSAIQKQIPNYEVKLMRPVGGRITEERAASSPYSIILWNIDSDDWNNRYMSGDSDEVNQEKINTIINNVMSKVSDGDIILMHDIWSNTYEATKIILEQLNAQGYEVVTVSELIGDGLAPGKTYTHLVAQ